MTEYYEQGQTSHVRRGRFKLSLAAGDGNAAGNSVTLENPESSVILIDRVVAEIKTAAEAASQLLVGIGDNINDNVENSAGMLLNVNALNIGTTVPGPAAGVNCNCRLNKNGETANAFILVGVDVPANADSLVADIYVDYIIP